LVGRFIAPPRGDAKGRFPVFCAITGSWLRRWSSAPPVPCEGFLARPTLPPIWYVASWRGAIGRDPASRGLAGRTFPYRQTWEEASETASPQWAGLTTNRSRRRALTCCAGPSIGATRFLPQALVEAPAQLPSSPSRLLRPAGVTMCLRALHFGRNTPGGAGGWPPAAAGSQEAQP